MLTLPSPLYTVRSWSSHTGRSGICCKILRAGCISLGRAGSQPPTRGPPAPRSPRRALPPVTRAPLHQTHLLRDEAPARRPNSQTRPPAAPHGTAHLPGPPACRRPRTLPGPGPPSPGGRPRRPWRAPRCCRSGAGAAPTTTPPPPCDSPALERGGRHRHRQPRAVTRAGRGGRQPIGAAAGAVLHAGSCSSLPSGEWVHKITEYHELKGIYKDR